MQTLENARTLVRMSRLLNASFALAVSLAIAGTGGGCGSSNQNSQFNGGDDATADGSPLGDDSGDSSNGMFGGGDGNVGEGGVHAFDVEPTALQTITVPLGRRWPPCLTRQR